MTTAIASPTRLMTAEEFEAWVNRPENAHRNCELVRGEVQDVSRPNRVHGWLMSMLVWHLMNYVRARGYGCVLSGDPGYVVERDPDTVRGPDIAVTDDGHEFDEQTKTWLTDPPTLIVEILSPTNRRETATQKLAEYLAAGVPVVWLVDPDAATVAVRRPNADPTVFRRTDTIAGDPELPGFVLPLRDIFTSAG